MSTEDMTCEELRSSCKELGRKQAGNKAELQERRLGQRRFTFSREL